MNKLTSTLLPVICLALSFCTTQSVAQTAKLITANPWKISEVTTPDTGLGTDELIFLDTLSVNLKNASQILFNSDHTYKTFLLNKNDSGSWKVNQEGEIEATSSEGEVLVYKASPVEKGTLDAFFDLRQSKDANNSPDNHLTSIVLHLVKVN